MNATLTHRTYPTNAGGTFTMVSGTVRWEGLTWRVSTTISQWSDGHWHVGQEADPEKYRVRHFSASKIGGGKLTALATIPETRALMRIVEAALAAGTVKQAPIYEDLWTCAGLVPTTQQIEIVAHAPTAPSLTQDAPATKENRTMSQCTIYRKYGLGERCTGTAVEGDPRNRCKLHVHLETLCGELPQQPGDFRPAHIKKAKAVVDAVAEAVVGVESATAPAVVIPDGAVARMTPDALAEAVAAEPAPSTPAQKPKKHVKKSAKKGASPKA